MTLRITIGLYVMLRIGVVDQNSFRGMFDQYPEPAFAFAQVRHGIFQALGAHR